MGESDNEPIETDESNEKLFFRKMVRESAEKTDLKKLYDSVDEL